METFGCSIGRYFDCFNLSFHLLFIEVLVNKINAQKLIQIVLLNFLKKKLIFVQKKGFDILSGGN